MIIDTQVLYLPAAKKFAIGLATALNVSAKPLLVQRFENGQRQIEMPERCVGQDVNIVQIFDEDVHGRLFEVFLALDALSALLPLRISLVLPYLPYSRSERPGFLGGTAGLSLLAEFLEAAGAQRIVTLSLHAPASVGAFRVPILDIDPFGALFSARGPSDGEVVLVAPDVGGAKRAAALAEMHGLRCAFMQKMRVAGRRWATELSGSVEKCCAVLVEDEVVSGQTICSAAAFLRSRGAKRVDALVAHAFFSEEVASRILGGNGLNRIFVTDSVGRLDFGSHEVKVVPMAGVLASAMAPVI